jgi:hypothetical protein
MSPDAIAFGGKTDVIEEGLRKNWAWGRRQSLQRDPREELYESCFPPMPGEPGPTSARAREMIAKYRERVAFDAMRDLIYHMGAVREGRTAVIAVTEGWVLYRPNKALTTSGSGRRKPTEDPTTATGRRRTGGTLTSNPQPRLRPRSTGVRPRPDGARDDR